MGDPMTDTNPAESMDAEGLPVVEEQPPGIDVELEQEGMMVPRDHPVAVGTDPAYPVTEAEQRLPEGVAERADREEPDFGEAPTGVPAQVLGGPTDEVVGAISSHAAPDVVAAEAVEADGPLGSSYADDDLAEGTAAPRFSEPDSGADGIDLDDEPEAVADLAEPTDDGLSAEEAAVHIEGGR